MDRNILEKCASIAEGLDKAGHSDKADAITELLRHAATKKDGESEGMGDYLSSAIERFADHFDAFARRIDGPTSRRAMAGNGIKPHRMGVLVAKIEDAVDEMRSLAKKVGK